ncbi:MAG: hypothetical protein HC836_36305 [Richelia sp. RM2_1_2]|nr:hypothetical protein [Richelia sp. RM1_1_1]NJO63467.1 hypothetical protein [Richelia sp. RM2_1_2]
MNYSVECIARKIAECLILIEEYQGKIYHLRKSIAELRCQPVIDEQGEVVSFSDFENDY